MMQLIETHKDIDGKRSLFFAMDEVPISVNNCYRTFVRSKFAVKVPSNDFISFKKRVKKTVPSDFKLLKGFVKVEIIYNFKTKHKRDVDNYSKTIFDSFNKVIWQDDFQAEELFQKRKIGCDTNLVSIVITEK